MRFGNKESNDHFVPLQYLTEMGYIVGLWHGRGKAIYSIFEQFYSRLNRDVSFFTVHNPWKGKKVWNYAEYNCINQIWFKLLYIYITYTVYAQSHM